MGDKTWAERFPEGRHIFYEGDDPEGFRAEIRERFGFDPGDDPDWFRSVGEHGERYQKDLAELTGSEPRVLTWEELNPGHFEPTYAFNCPAEHLDAIYGSGEYRLGS
jgi:hypothetical protein